MRQLTVKREKAMIAVLAKMNCYVNGKKIGALGNGEEQTYSISDEFVSFRCGLSGGVSSDELEIDVCEGEHVYVVTKIGAIKPAVAIDYEKSTMSAAAQTDMNEIIVSQDFEATKMIGNYFGINEVSRQWIVGKGIVPTFKNSRAYTYDDIVDFELIEDGVSSAKGGSLGRAAVGGLLFGGAGAIVGGVTGNKKTKEKCTDLMIKITVNDIKSPTEYIKFISTPVMKNSMAYKLAVKNAQEVLSILQLICSQRDLAGSDDLGQGIKTEISRADEIRQFKQLLDDGIITEEEFQIKKKQLMGI